MSDPAAAAPVRFYTGVGATDTPGHIRVTMTRFAAYLGSLGYRLRSGGAPGADDAFERGAPEALRDIFLPRKGFNGRVSVYEHPTEAAMAMGDRFHPLLASLEPGDPRRQAPKMIELRQFMGRNCHQVLGWALDVPSDFTLCWTGDGADGTSIPTTRQTGGTGQAIRVSAANGVPVYNLFHAQVLQRLLRRLDETGF